ncbi:helix-turn-helix transcriptional regulator [Nonomuraea sp. NPDC001699]
MLHGRDRDLAAIGGFVEAAANRRGRSLMITGEPGVGKSAVLHAAATQAADSGFRVLRASGTSFEGDLPFAGLHQLLHPLLDELTRLPERHQVALTTALGLASGPAPQQRTVADATLVMLRHASRPRPLLLAIDDLPWLDSGSALVLRSLDLAGTRIGMLAVTRDAHRTRAPRVHDLAPLDDRSASALLTDRFPDLPSPVRRRLLAEARGNPLILRELPTTLDADQLSGSAPLPRFLPLSQRLQAIFASRVADLTQTSRQMLLLAVLDGSREIAAFQSLLPGRVVAEALREAREAGLIDLDRATMRLTFRHPLIRSAVLDLSTAAEQRKVHEMLAARPDGDEDRRILHLAEAAIEPDEHVAYLLERLAHRTRERGDLAGAVAALTRAATLSPDRRDRSRRAAEAAYLGTDATGNLRDAPRLLEHLPATGTDAASLMTAIATAQHLFFSGTGDVDGAHRPLAKAVDAGLIQPEIPREILHEGLYTLTWISGFGARPDLWTPLRLAVTQLAPPVPDSLSLLISCFADPAPHDLSRLDDAITRLAAAGPVEVIRIGMAAQYVGRLEECRAALLRLLEERHADDHVTLSIHAMNLLSRHCYESGAWDQAAHLSEDGLRLSRRHGYHLLAQLFLHRQGMLAAVHGDTDQAGELADEITRFAAPRRLQLLRVLAAEVRTRAALVRGEYEAAFLHATSIAPAGALPRLQGPALCLVPDLVEAAVRSGHPTEAKAHVAALHQAHTAELSPRLALVTHGATAMISADDHFEQALTLPEAAAWPFDLARIRLFYGERLRRAKATQSARDHLTAALATFTRLNAAPWAERARSELRATGFPTASTGDTRLSPQQHEIATLAAAGMTNKQIAQRLNLSPRTVSTHLYQVFPKLGITSRASLRDALQHPENPR